MPLKVDWSSFNPQLDVKLTLQQIRSMRANVTWQRGMACPNGIVKSDNHRIDCTVCDGTGFLYDSGVTDRMLVTNVSLRQQYQSFGRFDAGMAMITAEPGKRLSWWDKITFNEAKITYSERFEPPVKGLVSKLKYAIVDEPKERGIVRLVSQGGTDQVLGTDYNIVNGAIQWVNKPKEQFYAARYLARPIYIVLDISHHFRNFPTGKTFQQKEETAEFPVMAVGRLDFLVGEEQKDT